MDVKEFLIRISNLPHVSGYETELVSVASSIFAKYSDVSTDRFGNLIARKKGAGKLKVMLAAHMDEIGLMVSHIEENGFVKFSRIGGVDSRNMVAQEVIIHGREKIFGVIGIKPPHLTKPEETKKNIEIHDMAIDTGYSAEKLKSLIRVGDLITINKKTTELRNDRLAGKSLDNTVGVAVLYSAMLNLRHFNHDADIYFTATAQEEVGLRGAVTSTYNINPDIAIAIDVGFGRCSELKEHESVTLGGGPGIAIGTNINRALYQRLKKVAQQNNIKHQIEVFPKMTGTDAAAIQISGNGVITGLLSVPLKYMHTPVEVVEMGDIFSCGKLISEFIIDLNNHSGEDLLCL